MLQSNGWAGRPIYPAHTPTCDVRRGRSSEGLVMVNHPHTGWSRMSPLLESRILKGPGVVPHLVLWFGGLSWVLPLSTHLYPHWGRRHAGFLGSSFDRLLFPLLALLPLLLLLLGGASGLSTTQSGYVNTCRRRREPGTVSGFSHFLGLLL